MRFRMQMNHLVAAGLLAATALAATDYEVPPTRRASEVLPAELASGPHHRVAEAVSSDGFWDDYRIESDFGAFTAHGSFLLRLRLRELEAIARLREMRGHEVAANAAVDSLVDTGELLVTVIKNPDESVVGVGGGVKRLFGRTKRNFKRTKETMKHDDAGSDEDASTVDKIEDTALGVGKEFVGVSVAKRRWAQRLGVDPYSRNAVLQKELDRVAKYDAAGRLSKKLLLRTSTILSVAVSVSGLVWEKDPDELITLNETRLKQMGVSDEAARAFRLN